MLEKGESEFMKKIHYLSFYSDCSEMPDREEVVSIGTKVRYIVQSLKRNGCDVTLVSTALPKNGNDCVCESALVEIDDKERHVYLPIRSSGKKGETSKVLRAAVMEYVDQNVDSEDALLVYHAPAYMPLYSYFQKRCPCFILELNDRYCFHYRSALQARVIDYLERKAIRNADGYILASRWLSEIIPNCAPYTVNYGDSTVASSTKPYRKSNKYRVLYAGVIEELRGAAYLVANAAKFLPDSIEICIAGFGNKEALRKLNKLIEGINADPGCASVSFVGCLEGEMLDEFLFSGDVAVNAHSYPKGSEWKAKYSFPSKIALYCGHGLYVITSCEEALSASDFAPCLRYFETGSAESLAEAILRYCEESDDEIDPRDIVRGINESFEKGLMRLFS